MDAITISLRVTAPDPDVARVSVGRRQFSIGRPVEFDEASPRVAAIEYALGAVGGEVVNGLRVFARRRRLVIDAVEAVVSGTLEHGLTYLEVVGEEGQPRIVRMHVKVFVRFVIIAKTDRFDHCVFKVRQDLDGPAQRRWLDALFAMRYDNPAHREMMDLEGLKAWLPGRTSGFGPLSAAAGSERFFERTEPS